MIASTTRVGSLLLSTAKANLAAVALCNSLDRIGPATEYYPRCSLQGSRKFCHSLSLMAVRQLVSIFNTGE